jgi:hypothetical protein
MKKVKAIVLAAVAMIVTSCGTQGNILGDILQGGTLGNVIISVIGAQKVTAQDLIGAWNYSGPGCAFTSENLLAKAGGEVAATRIKEKALPYYQQIGITSQNTNITFKQDGTYTANFRGTPMSGKWTYDEASSKVTLQSMLLTINCYAKRNANSMGFLFEASKLITLLQGMAALSGNSQLQGIGDLAKSYDGLRVGFDMK